METIFTTTQIQKLIPHRYPFLLVDRIIEMSENKIVGLKNVTINEPFFPGHFPHEPIMPAVLQIEAMAQVAGVWAMHSLKLDSRHSVYFMTIDKCKFRKPVTPGDTLRIEVEILKQVSSRISFSGKILVEDKVVSQGEMLAMVAVNPDIA